MQACQELVQRAAVAALGPSAPHMHVSQSNVSPLAIYCHSTPLFSKINTQNSWLTHNLVRLRLIPSITFQQPKVKNSGDYQCDSAMALAKSMSQKPHAVAARIVAAIPQNNFIEKVEVAGAGFINMHLKPEFLQREITKVGPRRMRQEKLVLFLRI